MRELDYEESWAPKNWCFLTVVLEKTLASPLDFKEIQPVHSKGDQISPGCSLEAMMVKLKLQYFGHLMRRVDSLEKTLMLGGIGGRRRRGGQRMRHHLITSSRGWMASPTRWTWVWVNSGFGDRQGGLAWWNSWGLKESEMTEWLNWTEEMSC